MMEVATSLINTYCETKCVLRFPNFQHVFLLLQRCSNLKILGYYHANSRKGDLELSMVVENRFVFEFIFFNKKKKQGPLAQSIASNLVNITKTPIKLFLVLLRRLALRAHVCARRSTIRRSRDNRSRFPSKCVCWRRCRTDQRTAAAILRA